MMRGIAAKTLLALAGMLLLQQSSLAQEVTATLGCANGGCSSGGCTSGSCGSCGAFSLGSIFPFLRCQQDGPRCHHGCNKPICSPCENPAWGYYNTCWTTWPFPADFSHCRMPVPAAEAPQSQPPTQPMPPATSSRPGTIHPGTTLQPTARKAGY